MTENPDTDEATQRDEWPDYTPLYDVVMDAAGMLALDFSARVGARPYITYEDEAWHGVSVGPFDNTEDGKTVMTTKELEIDGEEVMEMLDGARLVQVRSTQETPLDGFDDWVYQGLGEEAVSVDEYEQQNSESDTDDESTSGDPRSTSQPRPCGVVHAMSCGVDVECPVPASNFESDKTSAEIVEDSTYNPNE